MKKITLITLILFTAFSYAQVGINTNTPDASSALEIESTTGGILIPRLTETQRDAIVAPTTGLMIYQSDETAGFYYYNGSIWTNVEGVVPTLNGVLQQNNSAENQQIKNLQDPTEAQDAVTLAYINQQLELLVLDIDNDSDGYTENQGDCDDNNQNLNPDSIEIYDGIDNNCDGAIDENWGTVADIDNNSYTYFTYGPQQWTLSNAETVTYRDGTPIPQVTTQLEWTALTTGAWCYYNNDPTKSKMYNWYAIMGIHDTDPNTPNKEFAPEGWHVPTDTEWTTLENHLIANGYNFDETTDSNKIAKALASTSGWNTSENLGDPGNLQSGNNSSFFNVVPAGYLYNEGYGGEGETAVFWSSSLNETDTNLVWFRAVDNYSPNVSRGSIDLMWGFSVRFVKD
mgnify:FL=1